MSSFHGEDSTNRNGYHITTTKQLTLALHRITTRAALFLDAVVGHGDDGRLQLLSGEARHRARERMTARFVTMAYSVLRRTGTRWLPRGHLRTAHNLRPSCVRWSATALSTAGSSFLRFCCKNEKNSRGKIQTSLHGRWALISLSFDFLVVHPLDH